MTDPAIDPFVLAVGAADLRDSNLLSCGSVAPFSSRGSSSRTVDVVAPGVSIASLRDPGSTIDQGHPGAVVNGRFFRGSGTSQAAAVTSGAVALLLQARPTLSPDQVKALLRATATPLALLDNSAEGAGAINVQAAAGAALPWSSTQRWTAAAGTGSLEGARGGSHVAVDGTELVGEQDIMGQPWSGAAWAPDSAAATAWSGGKWNGQVWSGAGWTSSWTTPTWTGNSWTGNSWSGAAWSGNSWSGHSWSGHSWSGNSWSGNSWTGNSWTGAAW